MKETDDMHLFVFSSSALNRVNTATPMTAKVGGTKKNTEMKNTVVGWEFHPPHTGVCPPIAAIKTPEVKRNNGAASKTFG